LRRTPQKVRFYPLGAHALPSEQNVPWAIATLKDKIYWDKQTGWDMSTYVMDALNDNRTANMPLFVPVTYELLNNLHSCFSQSVVWHNTYWPERTILESIQKAANLIKNQKTLGCFLHCKTTQCGTVSVTDIDGFTLLILQK
jgi:hypothetical protein